MQARGQSSLTIAWDAVTTDTTNARESGPIYYHVYAETFPYFSPNDSNYVGTTTDTTFEHVDPRHDDPGVKFYYKVTAMDCWGNVSQATETVGEADFVLGKIKVLLEGAYDSLGDSLTTTLSDSGFLPLSSPYADAPRSVESVPSGTTDWILVELKAEESGPILSRQSFFLRKDGYLVEEDGVTTTLGLPDVTAGDYFLVIRHRNHLDVMSSTTLTMSRSSAGLYDFTADLEKYAGGDAKRLQNGRYAMYAADLNGDGIISLDDELATLRQDNLKRGYFNTDADMDGKVIQANELTRVRANDSKASALRP